MEVEAKDGLVTTSQRAALGKVTGAAGYPSGSRSPLVAAGRNVCKEDPGPLCNCDVWITAPPSWNDVTFRLRGRVGEVWSELDVVTSIADAQHAQITAVGGTTGLLFEWRGNPCDEFQVEGYHTGTDHGGSQMAGFIARAWGMGTTREVVTPYAPLRRERHNTVAVGAGPTTLLTAPTSGRSLWITNVEVSHDQAAAQAAALQALQPGPIFTTLKSWPRVPANNTLVLAYDSRPVRVPPGQVLVGVGVGGTVTTFNIQAFED